MGVFQHALDAVAEEGAGGEDGVGDLGPAPPAGGGTLLEQAAGTLQLADLEDVNRLLTTDESVAKAIGTQ